MDPKALYANYLIASARGLRDAANAQEALAEELLAQLPENVARHQDRKMIPIDDLELSTRTINVLKTAGINYLGDLETRTSREVRAFRNLGARSFNELREVMYTFEIKFKEISADG